jgi:4-aminobutyrate aminotransferase / (S)-3-amino-2-methylpropionate transaminase / 5-aminovalerate transaminase
MERMPDTLKKPESIAVQSDSDAVNSAWIKRRASAVPRGVSNLLPIVIDRASNAEIWDVEGKRYIDFGSGIAVLNTGHLHPRIKAAAIEQMDSFSHACFQITPYASYVRLAERLNALVPGPTPKKSILFSTGAEAVENAVKIARAHTGRSGVIAFSGGFHGRTLMAMALTGKVTPYKAGFGPLPGEVYHLPFPIEFHGIDAAQAMRALDTLFHADIDPKQIAAIIIEPIQGEGGFYVAPPEFMQALRAICDDHGIVLIADEVQTGFARSGRLFALEHSGIEADLVTMAKGLGGGFPISAVTGKSAIMDAPMPGGLGGTFAGSPIACAAAHAVIDVIEDEGLCARADEIGALIREHLHSLSKEALLAPVIGDIRGLGSMVALELIENGDPSKPAPALNWALVQACAKRGLIVVPCGVRSNVIRFMAPLTISDALLREGMSILGDTLRELVEAKP